jgi:hypothetical protein
MRINLAELAQSLNRTSGLYLGGDVLGDALLELSGPLAKAAYAAKLLAEESRTFAIPADAIAGLATRLADPATREGVVADLYGFGYADPAINWAGTGVTITMDRVFADRDGGELVVVAVPAGWSVDLWSSDSDLTDKGRSYYHWVAASLPSVPADSYEEPMQFVLLSSEIYGTLRWGGHRLSIFRGEVSIDVESQNRVFWDQLAGEAVGRPV